MQPIPTDDEIRASQAFPQLVRAFQLNNRIFWTSLPLFAAFLIFSVAERAAWAFVAGILLSVGNACGQVYAFRKERRPLSEISSSPVVRVRAQKLAREAAKPRFVRWLPGA